MGSILRSTWEGWGSAAFSEALRYTPFTGPKLLDAFVYGTTTSLVSRSIEHYHKREGTLNVIMVVMLKILAPYLLNPLLKRSLAIHVPTEYIHLENGIYLMALLDGEFAWTAYRLNPHGDYRRSPYRIGANLIHRLETSYWSLFD